MNLVKSAAVLAVGLATSAAAAQTSTIQYQGRVIDINDDLGIFAGFSLGLAASGNAVVDLEAEDLVIDIAGAENIGGFPILGLDTTVLDQTFDGSEFPGALILDDVFSNDFGPGPIDFVLFGGTIPQNTADDAFLGFDFQGGSDLFSDAGIGNTSSLDLENLDFAEVTIEFRSFGPDNTFTSSTLTIEVLSLTVEGAGRGVTLTCVADVNDDDEVDFGDFFAWVDAFGNNDFRADINLDGEVTGSDFFAWVNAFQSGECNAG